MSDKISLSPSLLNIYLECPRCFWLETARGIHRPRGAFPSLPGGMDGVLKKYFDGYRKKGELPPEIAGKVRGRLLDSEDFLLNWRVNLRGIRWRDGETGAELKGALDDCLVDGGRYIAVDYKTRGWAVKENSHEYYQNQLDCYALLLEKNGFPHPGFAYLVFYFPEEAVGEGLVKFKTEVVKVTVDSQAALKTFRSAVELIRGSIPSRHSGCVYCSWGNDYLSFE